MRDAVELYEAGEKKWSTDESKFITILGLRNFEQLSATFEEYRKVFCRMQLEKCRELNIIQDIIIYCTGLLGNNINDHYVLQV